MATTASAGVLSGAFFSLGCGGGASLCVHVQHYNIITSWDSCLFMLYLRYLFTYLQCPQLANLKVLNIFDT